MGLYRGLNTSNSVSLPAPTKPRGRSSSLKKSPRTPSVQPKEDCSVCNRRTQVVICTSPTCVHSFQGRLATWCYRHPNNCYLMDHPVNCPVCNSSLVEQKVLSKTDTSLTAEQSGTRVLRKPEKVLASGPSGPLLVLSAAAGRGS